MSETTPACRGNFVILAHFPLKLTWLHLHVALTVCECVGCWVGRAPLNLGLIWGLHLLCDGRDSRQPG